MRKVVFIVLFGFATLFSQTYCFGQDAEIEQAAKRSHLMLPTPPLGFHITRQALVAEEKFLGFQTILQSEGLISKVLIKVDLRADADFSDRRWRSGTIKGYVNGFAGSLVDAGFQITRKKLPDIENSDLTGTMLIEFDFENDQQQKLQVKKRVFFDSRGFDITVIAQSPEDFEVLTNWADRIQAVPDEE